MKKVDTYLEKLETTIELYKRNKMKNMKPIQWEINLNEAGNGKTFDICLAVSEGYKFQYKYHNVLDLRNTQMHFSTKDSGLHLLDYMVNIFVDPINGEVQNFVITSDMHGLISVEKEGKANGLIQLFDHNNSCLHSQQTKGIILDSENS